MDPIKLKLGVAIIKVNIKMKMLSEFRNSAMPRKGDKIIIGNPESNQWDKVLANKISGSE